ncbi:MAG: hypothetical protein ABFD65_12220 [Candidatus Polarisedimenticolia bacterium]
MGRKEKLLERVCLTTRGWTFDELRALAEAFGATVVPPTGGGSHWKFRWDDACVTVPRSGGPLLQCYVREIRDIVLEKNDADR